MGTRKLSKAGAEALLDEMSNRACPNGCKCVFCRVFDEGVQSGLHDAAIEFGRALDKLKRQISEKSS